MRGAIATTTRERGGATRIVGWKLDKTPPGSIYNFPWCPRIGILEFGLILLHQGVGGRIEGGGGDRTLPPTVSFVLLTRTPFTILRRILFFFLFTSCGCPSDTTSMACIVLEIGPQTIGFGFCVAKESRGSTNKHFFIQDMLPDQNTSNSVQTNYLAVYDGCATYRYS